MLNVKLNTNGFVNPTFSPSHKATQGLDIYSRLANLSQQNQWILFTGECSRSQYQELATHQMHCSKFIHMKPSQSQPEITVVMKAIQSGNASAIVASGDIDIVNQKLLQQLAAEHQCEVLFLDATFCHFH